MPQAMIVFKLPEENAEYKITNKAMDTYRVLCDIKKFLRDKIKYGELTEEQYKVYDEMRTAFHEMLEDNDINLDHLN